jgi:hypothetical protein
LFVELAIINVLTPKGVNLFLGGITLKENIAVFCLAVLLAVSTVFNASNAQAIKQQEMLEKVSIPKLLEYPSHMKVLEKYKDAKTLDDHQCKELLSAIGFEGKALKMAWTVAQKESNCRPKALNDNSKTGDNSFGIFQINMIDELGEARLKKFDLDSKKELFDPVTNARIAYYMSNKGKNWSAWTHLDGERFKELWAEYPTSKNKQ